jgi:rhodanese-related sulfurtransferase
MISIRRSFRAEGIHGQMRVMLSAVLLFLARAASAQNDPAASDVAQANNPLADFVARVQTLAKPEDAICVMCRSGGRSAIAVNMLAKAGFKNVYQIIDGMEGDPVKDPYSVFNGQRLKNA